VVKAYEDMRSPGNRSFPFAGSIRDLGAFLSASTLGAGYTLGLVFETFWQVGSLRRRHTLEATLRQMFVCGIQTIPVTLVVSIFTGAILALNGGLTLEQIGQESLMGRIVAVSMTREMGPFMTALILAASVGSGMAAELGTMKVSEEVDALEIMAVRPTRFLVLPRLLAMMVMTPILTVYTCLVGILGGAIVSHYQYGVSFQRFRIEALLALTSKDIYTGLLKAFLFGIVIAAVGCSQGLRASGGAIGVGQATRRAVVVSYLLIIILGYYVTFLFFRVRW
jgi:phospholipid/cholesterol/gamma-HCH transport system permease protein